MIIITYNYDILETKINSCEELWENSLEDKLFSISLFFWINDTTQFQGIENYISPFN